MNLVGATLPELARFVSKLPVDTKTTVAIGPLSGADTLRDAARSSLWTQLHNQMAPAVPLGSQIAQEPLSREQASAKALEKSSSLLYLSPSFSGGRLNLEAKYIKWTPSFWGRTKNPNGVVVHHAMASVLGDATVRRYFGIQEIASKAVLKIAQPVHAIQSLLCTDQNNDGNPEVWIAGRIQLARGVFVDGDFVVEKTVPLGHLAAVNPTPLKAPLSSVTATESGAVLGTSDRASLLYLDTSLRVIKEAPPAFPLQDGKCSAFSSTGLANSAFDCGATPKPSAKSLDAWWSGTHIELNGTKTALSAQLPTGATAASLQIERVAAGALTLDIANVGDSFCWGDLNGDGAPEFVHSRASDTADEDAIVIQTLRDSQLVEVLELKAPAVRAVSICPFVGKNPSTVVAAVGEELWFIR